MEVDDAAIPEGELAEQRLTELTEELAAGVEQRGRDGREVERGRVGASGLVSREARVRGSGVEAELQLPRR